MKKTTCIVDLTSKLLKTLDELVAGDITDKQAAVRAQVANSICAAVRTQIVYNKMTGSAMHIKFLENPKEVKQIAK